MCTNNLPNTVDRFCCGYFTIGVSGLFVSIESIIITQSLNVKQNPTHMRNEKPTDTPTSTQHHTL